MPTQLRSRSPRGLSPRPGFPTAHKCTMQFEFSPHTVPDTPAAATLLGNRLAAPQGGRWPVGEHRGTAASDTRGLLCRAHALAPSAPPFHRPTTSIQLEATPTPTLASQPHQ